jgi:hypothetical protein
VLRVHGDAFLKLYMLQRCCFKVHPLRVEMLLQSIFLEHALQCKYSGALTLRHFLWSTYSGDALEKPSWERLPKLQIYHLQTYHRQANHLQFIIDQNSGHTIFRQTISGQIAKTPDLPSPTLPIFRLPKVRIFHLPKTPDIQSPEKPSPVYH